MPPKQSTLDAIAAGISGFTQGRHLKSSREQREEEFEFSKQMSLRQDARAEEEAKRAAQRHILGQQILEIERDQKLSDQEKSRKTAQWLVNWAKATGQDPDTITRDVFELIQEETRTKASVKSAEASTEASRASAAHSRALTENARITGEILGTERDFAKKKQWLGMAEALDQLGYRPAQTRFMEETGELLTRKPESSAGAITPSQQLGFLKEMASNMTEFAKAAKGQNSTLNAQADIMNNQLMMQAWMMAGNDPELFQPTPLDYSSESTIQALKDLDAVIGMTESTGILGAEPRPGMEETNRDLVGRLNTSIQTLMGGGATAQPSAQPPSRDVPLTDEQAAAFLETLQDEIERQSFVTEFQAARKQLGRNPSLNEMEALADQANQSAQPSPLAPPAVTLPSAGAATGPFTGGPYAIGDWIGRQAGNLVNWIDDPSGKRRGNQ